MTDDYRSTTGLLPSRRLPASRSPRDEYRDEVLSPVLRRPTAEPVLRWPRAHRLLLRAAWLVGGLQVAVGSIWWVGNLGVVPAYGDTPEYIELAKTLQVDEYRTLAYPVAVRLSTELATWSALPWQLPIYLAQTLLAALAAWYVVRSLAPRLPQRGAVAAAALVTTSPLVLHYATSVLSDSFAASCLAVALAGAVRVAVHDDRRWMTVGVTAAGALGTALMRTEKAMVLIVFAVVALVVVVLAHRRGALRRSGRVRAIAVVLVLGLALPATAASLVNDATQTADLGRPAEDLTTAAVSRIVWSHVGEIRDDLPPVARDGITAADAAAFDGDYNTIGELVHRLREMDGGDDAITNAAIEAALRCCALTIGVTIAVDAAEFAFVPVTLAAEGVPAILSETPTPTATLWNLTRMNQAHPRLSALLLLVSWALLPLLVAAVVAGRLRTAAPAARCRRNRAVLIVWLGTVLNGCVFAAAQGADANIRYGLSNAFVLMCALAVWVLASGSDAEPAEELREADPMGAPRTAGSSRSGAR